MKEIYPDAIFPPIYFLMGCLSNMGTPDGFAGMHVGSKFNINSNGL
ncbi:hypothetical protein A33Q_1391 [Indibacter alkaliphilus LW1]|uniref:Uncharacterized protein n=1 Tax=Indibacter alkaliphilus (strain CCUG 57479 / KCTC 22604 / LW1) TaxID=1189612 RepID=S2DIB0_INDAL|nr:hypothetical protein A33Q_1391 [Indibacter alkaliphilus LW1]